MNEAEKEFFDRIYSEFYRILTRTAKNLLLDKRNAEDVVQETFIVAVKKIDELMQTARPLGWLINTLKFNVRHERRAKERYCKVFQEVEDFDELPNTYEDTHDFELLDILNKPEYEVLRLVYAEGYDTKEAAMLLGIEYEACKKRIQTAKRRLAQELLK